MRPYGVKIIEWPDMADLHNMGAKSSAGSVSKHGGKVRNHQSPVAKAASRRYWARRARAEGKRLASGDM